MIQLNLESKNHVNFEDSIVIDDPGWGRYIPPGYISLPQYEEI